MEPHYPLFYVFHSTSWSDRARVGDRVVTRRARSGALWLVNTMFSLAVLFVMLDARSSGVMQVLVYAGAIMVVFLFVVMLLNLGTTSSWRLCAGPLEARRRTRRTGSWPRSW